MVGAGTDDGQSGNQREDVIGVGVLAAQATDGPAADAMVLKGGDFAKGVAADFADGIGRFVLQLEDFDIEDKSVLMKVIIAMIIGRLPAKEDHIAQPEVVDFFGQALIIDQIIGAGITAGNDLTGELIFFLEDCFDLKKSAKGLRGRNGGTDAGSVGGDAPQLDIFHGRNFSKILIQFHERSSNQRLDVSVCRITVADKKTFTKIAKVKHVENAMGFPLGFGSLV